MLSAYSIVLRRYFTLPHIGTAVPWCSPYPIPACESWEELQRWYRRAAELLPDAGQVMVPAVAAPLE